MHGKELLNADQAAELLNVSKRTVLKWARHGKIGSVRPSKKVVLFTADAIDEFVTRNSTKAEPSHAAHRSTGRANRAPASSKKGGNPSSSRKSWRSLRTEVTTWQ